MREGFFLVPMNRIPVYTAYIKESGEKIPDAVKLGWWEWGN